MKNIDYYTASAMTIIGTFAYLLWVGADINWITCCFIPLAAFGWTFLLILFPGLSRNVLGNFINYLLLGVVPAVATSYLVAGSFYCGVLFIALPFALLSDGIAHSINTRDVLAGKESSTLADALGVAGSVKFYAFEMIFPYVWLCILSMMGLLPVYTIVVFLTIPVALGCAKTLYTIKAGETEIINDIDSRTANLYKMFSMLLILSLVVAHFI